MTISETILDIDQLDDGDIGTLLITDATLLIDNHRLLELGNDMGLYTVHIRSHLNPLPSSLALDQTFHDLINGLCYDLWCDASVDYLADTPVDTDPPRSVVTKAYGFSDGAYTLRIKVYCRTSRYGRFESHRLIGMIMDDLEPGQSLIVVDPAATEQGFQIRRIVQ